MAKLSCWKRERKQQLCVLRLEQNRLDVRQILHKHSLKSIFAFNPRSGRAALIRFNPETKNSILHYRNDVVLYIDSEPK
ncbi:hypothetical protein RYX36_015566, partial [Vicia faba]